MDMPLKGFSQNRRDIGLKLLGSERSLVLGNGITLAAFSYFVQCTNCKHESKIPQHKEEQASVKMS